MVIIRDLFIALVVSVSRNLCVDQRANECSESCCPIRFFDEQFMFICDYHLFIICDYHVLLYTGEYTLCVKLAAMRGSRGRFMVLLPFSRGLKSMGACL